MQAFWPALNPPRLVPSPLPTNGMQSTRFSTALHVNNPQSTTHIDLVGHFVALGDTNALPRHGSFPHRRVQTSSAFIAIALVCIFAVRPHIAEVIYQQVHY